MLHRARDRVETVQEAVADERVHPERHDPTGRVGNRLSLCDWWRWLDHQVHLRRDELHRFEHELGAYLDSASGRFDLWYAERERIRRSRDRAA